MIKARFIPLCSALLACGLAFGQAQQSAPPAPPNPPSPTEQGAHMMAFLTQMLSLTPDQQEKAQTIFNTTMKPALGLHSSMDAAHQALDKAVENNDAPGIAVASEKIGQLTAQQTQAHATAQAAFRTILTPDQLTKFKTLHEMGPHGFGPPHGPGAMALPPPPPPPGA